MNSQFLTEWLEKLPLPERIRALDSIMYDLTICARDFFRPAAGSEDKPRIIQKLLGFNELYHQLSQQIRHYLDGEEEKVYPVAVFSQILFDKATHYEILFALTSSITHAKTGRWPGGGIAAGQVSDRRETSAEVIRIFKILEERSVDVNKLEHVIRMIEDIGPKVPE